jgi:hypothetical protein
MIDITLHKEKYRTKKQGYKNGSYRSRAGNSHGKVVEKTQGTGPRRRQGLGATTLLANR